MLAHWPVQIRLISPAAPFLAGADLVVAADCVPVAHPTFQRDFVKDKVVMIGCPKFDDLQDYVQRFARIFSSASVRSVAVAVMEVPCCQSLPIAVLQGLRLAGSSLTVDKIVVGTSGEIVGREALQPDALIPEARGCGGGGRRGPVPPA
jgi:hypothetical protein